LIFLIILLNKFLFSEYIFIFALSLMSLVNGTIDAKRK